jgi:hypothetical protein|tara:strand:+ start:1357 stop:1536 length:180 start_codon:yes stop_codon:yes gene_type:complete
MLKRILEPKYMKSISRMKVPLSFYKIPYDEQYEPRDFIREVKSEEKEMVRDKDDNKENK